MLSVSQSRSSRVNPLKERPAPHFHAVQRTLPPGAAIRIPPHVQQQETPSVGQCLVHAHAQAKQQASPRRGHAGTGTSTYKQEEGSRGPGIWAVQMLLLVSSLPAQTVPADLGCSYDVKSRQFTV